MNNILVTGATGFIGQHVIRSLCQRYPDVEIGGLTRYVSALPSVESMYWYHYDDIDSPYCRFKKTKWDVVVHLAANPRVSAKPADLAENISITLKLLNDISNPDHIPHFVFASSATVYGDYCVRATNLEVLSDDISYDSIVAGIIDTYKHSGETHRAKVGKPLNPTSFYGHTKKICENIVQAYREAGIINTTILRLTANVGPGSTHGLLHDIIRKLRSDSKELELLGDCPGSLKPYMHVRDTADMIVETIVQKLYGVHDLGTDNPLTVEDVADIAMKELGIIKPIKWLGKQAIWSGDNPIVNIDSSKTYKYLNKLPQCRTSFAAVQEAIKEIK